MIIIYFDLKAGVLVQHPLFTPNISTKPHRRKAFTILIRISETILAAERHYYDWILPAFSVHPVTTMPGKLLVRWIFSMMLPNCSCVIPLSQIAGDVIGNTHGRMCQTGVFRSHKNGLQCGSFMTTDLAGMLTGNLVDLNLNGEDYWFASRIS
jgi:hypothetical protein